MQAAARLAVAADPGLAGRTSITRLRSEPPISLRPTLPIGASLIPRWHLRHRGHVWVRLAAAAAGPIGGDHISLDVDVGAGATLVARSVAASLLLPGPHSEPSRSDVTIHVGAGATLVWAPGPVIAVRGCDHHATTRLTLEPTARLLVIDELVLGRHGEPPGTIRQHLRICLGDSPLHDQDLRLGPDVAGSTGPAVTGGRRAVGSAVIVDPDVASTTAFQRPNVRADITTARLPLGGPAALITILAPDLLALRQRLTTALAEFEQSLAGSPLVN